MLFEICNVLCDCASTILSLEYSIDVTLKNQYLNEIRTKIMYTFHSLGPQICLGGGARRKSLVFEFQICQCYSSAVNCKH